MRFRRTPAQTKKRPGDWAARPFLPRCSHGRLNRARAFRPPCVVRLRYAVPPAPDAPPAAPPAPPAAPPAPPAAPPRPPAPPVAPPAPPVAPPAPPVAPPAPP